MSAQAVAQEPERKTLRIREFDVLFQMAFICAVDQRQEDPWGAGARSGGTGTRDGDKTIARVRRPLRLLNPRRRAEHAPSVVQCLFPYPCRTSRVGSDLPDCARDGLLANTARTGQSGAIRVPTLHIGACAGFDRGH